MSIDEKQLNEIVSKIVSDMKGKGLTPFQENDILFAKITPCMENGKGAIAQNLFNGFGGTPDVRQKRLIDVYNVIKKYL